MNSNERVSLFWSRDVGFSNRDFGKRVGKFRRMTTSARLFFSEQPFYGNYSTVDSHKNTVNSHAFAFAKVATILFRVGKFFFIFSMLDNLHHFLLPQSHVDNFFCTFHETTDLNRSLPLQPFTLPGDLTNERRQKLKIN